MSTVAHRIDDLAERFGARCALLARRYADGTIDLHRAVDTLQADAETSGIIDEIGQDEVQRLMAAAFKHDGGRP
jgi:hypothetical protein